MQKGDLKIKDKKSLLLKHTSSEYKNNKNNNLGSIYPTNRFTSIKRLNDLNNPTLD